MTAPITDPPTTGTTRQPDSIKAAVPETETVYLILKGSTDGTTWTIDGGVTARDRNQAIQKHAEQNGNRAGTFVAVTKKQWKPIVVTPQTVTTLKLEEAK